MKRLIPIALIAGLAASGAVSSAAHEHTPQGPKANPGPAAKAYGKYCRTESRKHVKGVKGTPFSNCVRAMARADRNDSLTARRACRELGRKHVKGVKGTPFSRCIVGVAQMRKQQPPQGPKANLGPAAKAYGKYCRTESRKHVKGVKGTPFSNCVRAMARADRNDSLTARRACRELGRKHVKGVKGTPFSRCIVGVAQMRKHEGN